ncbi:MAG: hypothetical protein AAGU11_04545 [Syntrophobacteraceae bacterium]
MNRLVATTACVLVCLLCAGCAQKLLSSHSVESLPVQPEAAQICLLDPTAHLAENQDKLVPLGGDLSPVVEILETTHDFGTFCEEKELVHKFSIRNAGKSVLNIKKVVPG